MASSAYDELELVILVMSFLVVMLSVLVTLVVLAMSLAMAFVMATAMQAGGCPGPRAAGAGRARAGDGAAERRRGGRGVRDDDRRTLPAVRGLVVIAGEGGELGLELREARFESGSEALSAAATAGRGDDGDVAAGTGRSGRFRGIRVGRRRSSRRGVGLG